MIRMLLLALWLGVAGCRQQLPSPPIAPVPPPPQCQTNLPVRFGISGKFYTLEPADARALLSNIEGLRTCIGEYVIWGRELQKWQK